MRKLEALLIISVSATVIASCTEGSTPSPGEGPSITFDQITRDHIQVFGLDGAPGFSVPAGRMGVIDCLAWSPDGKTFAVSNIGGLWSVPVYPPFPAHMLWSTSGIVTGPTWAADSQSIYFSTFADSGQELRSESVLGGQPTALGLGDTIHPDPSGRNFVITGSQGILTRQGIDGETTQIATKGLSPSWASDGKGIAYELDPSDETKPPNIVTMTSTGSHRRILTWGEDPSYSPDGKYIAFLRATDYFGALFVRNLRTGVTTQVSPSGSPVSECQPTWSPDSHHLAVVVVDNGPT